MSEKMKVNEELSRVVDAQAATVVVDSVQRDTADDLRAYKLAETYAATKLQFIGAGLNKQLGPYPVNVRGEQILTPRSDEQVGCWRTEFYFTKMPF